MRAGLLAGRLGTETFVDRVDAAYRAKTHDDLATLTDDLPRHRRLAQLVFGRFTGARPAPTRLHPPAMVEGERRVLGRSSSCDYAIADPTVSTRHAELERLEGGWLIRDLDSRNGTRVNGWLVREREVQAGDLLEFGASAFVFRPLDP